MDPAQGTVGLEIETLIVPEMVIQALPQPRSWWDQGNPAHMEPIIHGDIAESLLFMLVHGVIRADDPDRKPTFLRERFRSSNDAGKHLAIDPLDLPSHLIQNRGLDPPMWWNMKVRM